MPRSSRMFEIIQLLRSATQPVTSAQIAAQLEVTPRTIYRDIASLQSMRVRIEGAAGVGYIMRSGFNLPPLNFDIEEAEAITVGLSMIARTGDKSLQRAAHRAAAKIAQATPLSETLFSSTWGADAPEHIDLSAIRQAIRDEQKLEIVYANAEGIVTQRIVLPISIIYYSEAIVLPAWCELRNDFRHFRIDRLSNQPKPAGSFKGQSIALRKRWATLHATNL
jgi:predicted DNA-binding transcriptional regulator YafY